MFDMKNNKIPEDRWYIQGNERRVACMSFFVIIRELENIVKLDVIQDGVNVALTLDFLSIDQAMNFTSDIINNTCELEEVKSEYDKIVKNYEWIREINNINAKSDKIVSFTSEVVEYYKNIEKEYVLATKFYDNVINDNSISQKQKDNYCKYYYNLKESYERIKKSCEDFYIGLNSFTDNVDNEIQKNNLQKTRAKTK